MSSDKASEAIVRKLRSRISLDDADCEAVRSLPCVSRTFEPATFVVREGAPPHYCSFVLSGLAFRQKLTSGGVRQIVSIHLAGDFLDLQHLFLQRADHNVQALTRLTTADIDRNSLQDVALQRPTVGRAIWIDALIDGSIFREWLVNVGRRSARERVSHLLCEFSLRMRVAGIAEGDGYELPLTQEQLGDAVGLTSVHVNRMLRELTRDGLIERNRRFIRIRDWDGMCREGDFNPNYLHLDQLADV